ncbi:MAG: nucleotidyl transferase AbiEii/AbiGii toxin family protein [Planctomycetes bacterium]|nr:nucleotidyl transferase AbiEii/AbiGii toxin family protein [Planctomycetota bacterium]
MFEPEVFRGTVQKVARVLRGLRIRFHITGGFATQAYMEPRFTQDVDFVVDPLALERELERFLTAASGEGLELSAAAVRAALERRGLFQVLDVENLLKADIYARELVPGELSRSLEIELFAGLKMPIVSRADAALSKLIWISKGSHKSRRDLRLLWRSATSADRAEVELYAAAHGLVELLHTVLSEREELLE